MSALTGPRSATVADLDPNVASYPVAASVTCYDGGIAVLASGYCQPGTTATGLVCVGVFDIGVHPDANAPGVITNGVVNGAKSVRVRRGVRKFANSADSDAIAQANVGAPCFIVDDQTVALTDGSGTRSVAGQIKRVDSSGVWVELGSVNGTALASEITARSALGTAQLAVDALTPAVLKALTFAVADGATGNIDVVLAQKVRIVSAAFHKNTAAGGASDTIRLANGATTNYICGAIDNNVAANTVTAAGTIVSTYSTIDAGGTLRIIRTKASAANVGGWVELTVVGVA